MFSRPTEMACFSTFSTASLERTGDSVAMKLTENLSDFNRRMADELRSTFASSVKPFQSEEGVLLFRGPISGHKDPKHVGTHVAVVLEKDVVNALNRAEPHQREEMVHNLLSSLGTQVKAQYNPSNLGADALQVIGTMPIVKG